MRSIIMNLAVVTLAAGKGSRMKSDLPKGAAYAGGQTHAGACTGKRAGLRRRNPACGDRPRRAKGARHHHRYSRAVGAAKRTKGTGHAVAQAMPDVHPDATVLVLYGDVPLIRTQTLQQLLNETASNHSLALLTVELDNPTGYGRIVRNAQGEIQAIVEHKDANAEQHKIKEVNTGILAVSAKHLNAWLPKLSANNAQGEYYLTDIIAMAVAQGVPVNAIHPQDEFEVQGVNDRLQLAELERVYQRRLADDLMRQGVSLADPSRIDIRGSLKVGSDVVIDVGCVFEGEVVLEDGVHIGPYCVIKNSHLGAQTAVEAFCHLEDAKSEQDCHIGPYARLRPGADLKNHAKVGNFCEEKAVIGEGAKVNHLTYIGDAQIGKDANIGAGTITCNYDGVNKFKTVIGERAFIGSNSALVAP